MHTDQAVSTVNGMIYLPGWTFTATDHTARFAETIKVRVDYPAVNTNRDQAPDYCEPIMTYAQWSVTVGDCQTTADLHYKIIGHLMEIWSHETREALRDSGTLEAQFHPHRLHTMQRWSDKTGRPVSDDLAFGLA